MRWLIVALIGYGLEFAIDHKEAQEFLKTLTENVNKDETRDAYVLAKTETAHFGLLLGDLDTTKKDLEECSKHLDSFDSVDPQINASFLRVSADYYKVRPLPVEGQIGLGGECLTKHNFCSCEQTHRSRQSMLSITSTHCCTWPV